VEKMRGEEKGGTRYLLEDLRTAWVVTLAVTIGRFDIFPSSQFPPVA